MDPRARIMKTGPLTPFHALPSTLTSQLHGKCSVNICYKGFLGESDLQPKMRNTP